MTHLEDELVQTGRMVAERVRPCPVCKKPVIFRENPHRPFCSRRCKLLDLSAWLTGEYFGLTEQEMQALEGDTTRQGD
ncbi:MAG: DNA gyrase inhibitor YacG [Deltaproteobacteria bacterium]|jgi:endogenous inhibitor of DNA gyrase (YacG/DUF329 family)|nr:DNA gyrase inhibitor YacG [Deltaproteobacteria bacterium]